MGQCKVSMQKEYVKIDGWRGYNKPKYAVIGATDTGTWSDSPCNSHDVQRDIKIAKKMLKDEGFCVRSATGNTSNVFAGKRYLVVPPEQFERAKEVAKKIDKHKRFDSGCVYVEE